MATYFMSLLGLVCILQTEAVSQGYLFFRNVKNTFTYAGDTRRCVGSENFMEVHFGSKYLQLIMPNSCDSHRTYSSQGYLHYNLPHTASGQSKTSFPNANSFSWKIQSQIDGTKFSNSGSEQVTLIPDRIAHVYFNASSYAARFEYDMELVYATDLQPKIVTLGAINPKAVHLDSVTLVAPPFLASNLPDGEIHWWRDGHAIKVGENNDLKTGRYLTVKYRSDDPEACKPHSYMAKSSKYEWLSQPLEVKFSPNIIIGTDIIVKQPSCILSQAKNDSSRVFGELSFSKSLIEREFSFRINSYQTPTLTDNSSQYIFPSTLPIPLKIVEIFTSGFPSCPQYDTLHILPPRPITIDSSRFNDINCFGGTASYTLQIGSQANKDTVLLDDKLKYVLDKDKTFTIPDIPRGNHTLRIKDQNGCVLDSTISFTAVEPPRLEPAIALEHPLCHAGTGTAHLSIKGGTPPYQYRFERDSNYSSSRTATRVAGSRLGPSVMDGKGCVATLRDTVLKNPADFFPTAVVKDHNRCFNDSIAEALVTVKGNGNYAFSKDSLVFQSAPLIRGLPTGRQILFVRNDSLCIKQVQATIRSLPKMNVSTIRRMDATCAGDSNGSFYFQVSSGNGKKSLSSNVLPAYSSNATAFNHLYEHLKAQAYQFAVIDDSGCIQRVNFVIGTRSNMHQTFSTLSPTCMLSEDGEISASTLGGVKPYNYEWIGQTSRTATQTRLKQGSYAVKVTDSLSCTHTDTVYLKANIQIPVKLQGHPYLCKGQQLELDAGASGQTYTWTKGQKAISNKRRLTIDSGGTYTVTVKGRTGCTGTDSLQVHYVDKAIEPSFLMSTKAVVGDIVVLAVNSLGYDQVSWSDSIPNVVVRDSNSQHIKEYIFTQPGEYQVPMTIKKDNCVATVWKSIQIYPSSEKQEVEQALGIKSKLIRRVLASPNPSKGEFTLEVELEYPADMEVSLFDIAKGSPILHKSLVGKNSYDLPFEQNLSQGLYMLYVKAGEETASYRVLVTNE